MARAIFSDNLYGNLSEPHRSEGAGLFAHAGPWFYERHANLCKPGCWRVGVIAYDEEFWQCAAKCAVAVMDDFGNLRRVQ